MSGTNCALSDILHFAKSGKRATDRPLPPPKKGGPSVRPFGHNRFGSLLQTKSHSMQTWSQILLLLPTPLLLPCRHMEGGESNGASEALNLIPSRSGNEEGGGGTLIATSTPIAQISIRIKFAGGEEEDGETKNATDRSLKRGGDSPLHRCFNLFGERCVSTLNSFSEFSFPPP